MSEPITTGQDAGALASDPDAAFPGAPTYQVAGSSVAALYRFFPIPIVPGQVTPQTLLTITLKNVAPSVAGKTITVRAPDAGWDANTLTFNNQPAVRAASATGSTGATTPLSRQVTIDVTALVQPILGGLPNNGFRITVGGLSSGDFVQVLGFTTTVVDNPTQLQVNAFDVPSAPVTQTPAGGEVDGPFWPCRTEYTDLGGETEFGGMQVQVSPAADPGTAWDSGMVTDLDGPELDLADTTYPGLADGATTSWRSQTMSADGIESGYGPWVQVTRATPSALINDHPTDDGAIASAKPTIRAHVEGTHPVTGQPWKIAALRIFVYDDKGRERYDSGRQPNRATDPTTLAWQIPFRASAVQDGTPTAQTPHVGRVVFSDEDAVYTIRTRAYLAGKRQWGGSDETPWLQNDIDVTFAPDGLLVPPDQITAEPAPGGPGAIITFSLPLAAPVPDFFTIGRNGLRLVQPDLEPISGDNVTEPLTYQYIDRGALPNTVNSYWVRSGRNHSDGPTESEKSPSADTTNNVTGLWLCSPLYGNVVFRGKDISGLGYSDKRTEVPTPYRSGKVTIITAVDGLSGPFTGTIDERDGDVDEARAIVEQIRQNSSEPLYLVIGTMAALVTIEGLSVFASNDMKPRRNRVHRVSWTDCTQVGEYEQAG